MERYELEIIKLGLATSPVSISEVISKLTKSTTLTLASPLSTTSILSKPIKSRSVALTFAPADGVAAGVGMGESGNALVANESNQLTGFVTYAAGPVSLGYQMSEEETQGAANWNTQQWGVTFNVSDNIAVGYGERTVDRGNQSTADEEDRGFSASYTMGSMSIAGNMNKSDDTHGVLNSDNETTEIALSFAF